MEKYLVIGAFGQLGTELVEKMRAAYGVSSVIAADIRLPEGASELGPAEQLDIMNRDQFHAILKRHKITQVFHLAALLSAKGEQNPLFAWDLNMQSLLTVLEAGRDMVKKIYWPSSIAVFGPNTPKDSTPQETIMDPNTVYGISKLSGERWCQYYFDKYNVDARSLRYPGLIGWKALPGGGTTDYAVDIFHKAINNEDYSCFLKPNTSLPMMYMDDAVKATLEIMEAPHENIKVRSSYNVSSMSFNPEQLVAEIKNYYPGLQVGYVPDFRQQIAESWPSSINDQVARQDWGWSPDYNLPDLVKVMVENLSRKQAIF